MIDKDLPANPAEERMAKKQLINELAKLRQRISELEKLRVQQKQQSGRELKIRNQIDHIFLTEPDDETYGEVLQVILEALESKYGIFGYINEDGALVCPSMTRDIWEQGQVPDKSIAFPLETWGRICGRALKEKKTFYSNKPFRVPEGHVPILRALDVPIIHKKEVTGNILVGNKATAYDKKDIKLLETIAAHIAPILYARLQRDRKERERRRTEGEIQTQKAYLNQLFESTPEGIVLADKEGHVLRVNSEFTKLFGYEIHEIHGRSLDKLIVPEDYYEEAHLTTKKVVAGEIEAFEAIRKRKDGTHIDVSVLASPIILDGELLAVYGIYRDISKRKKAEKKIEESLKDKEVLLREIHHRVKNNLQIISSLLKLQSQYLDGKQYVDMLKDSENRIKSISLIHEMFYTSKHLSKINFKKYIKIITDYLFRSCWDSPGKIALKIDSANVSLPVDNAIPCGLIIHELVSNSLKHAFPDGKEGEIKIGLRSINEKDIKLVVSDDGVGIPEDFDFRNTKSMGLHLVTILAEDQLHGEIKLDRNKGTEFQIRLRGVK